MEALNNEIVNKAVMSYVFKALALLMFLTIAISSYPYLASSSLNLATPVFTSIIYNLIISALYIYIWKLIARYSPDSLMHLYLGGTGLRLISAAFVMLIYCYLVQDRTLRMSFAIVFCVYYMAMLIFDTLFFVKFERVNRFVK